MSPLLYQRLLNEAIECGTEEVLQRMPAEYSPELEQAIRRGVHQALLCYADGLDSLGQRLQPLERGKARV